MSTTTGNTAHTLKPAVTPQPNSSRSPAFELPDEPLAKIQSSKSWSFFDLGELWAHRELLYFLTLRDLKVRYKQTLLGVSWVVMQPLLMTLTFTVFLGMLVRVPTNGIPYPLVAYSGLLPWMFVSGGVGGCSMSLVANSNLITKVYFPRVLVPTAYIGTRVIDFAISFVILVGLMLVYRFGLHYPLALTWNLALLPLVFVLLTVFTLSLGILVSCLNVRYRDVGVAVPVLIQIWMFASPVVYPVSPVVPERWRTLYFLNPLAGLIQGFRSSLLGGEVYKFGLAVSAVATIALLFASALIFRRIEKGFADVI